ncbi:hypothetical protein GN956_G25551 [Arapaima gigas]
MRRHDSDSNGLFSSGDNSDRDHEGASCPEPGGVCGCGRLCERGQCANSCETRPQAGALKGQFSEIQWGLTTRYSEGYGTEEECVQSDPQGESDADADIEDTDCRFPEAGSLHRISSRRRRRPRVARQDTTESEDDGGRSHRGHRWNLRLSPHRTHSRTILEESVSQVRPLVLCRPCAGPQQSGATEVPKSATWSISRCPPFLLLSFVLLLLLPVFAIIIIVLLLMSPAST